VFDATGVDTFAGHRLQAFPHLSESFSQQHRQLLAFLTALSSSSDSLLTHHRQHQPELLLSTLCDIRRPPGSDFGALLGVALTSFSVALLMLHQQHQPVLISARSSELRSHHLVPLSHCTINNISWSFCFPLCATFVVRLALISARSSELRSHHLASLLKYLLSAGLSLFIAY